MLGFIGIVLGIAAVVFLAWKRWSAAICALVGSLIVGLFNGFGVWGTFTNFFLPAAGGWIGTFILMFMSSALYAKLMADTGAAASIAYKFLDLVGKKNVFLALSLVVMVLTYGGVSGLIIVFVVWPLMVPLAKELNKPRYLFLTIMYFGFLTGAYTSLPGTPQNSNVLAAQFLGTSGAAAPGLGIIATVIMFVLGYIYIMWLDKRATAKGRTFEDDGTGMKMTIPSREEVPSFANSIIPLVVLILLFMTFSKGWFGIPKMGAAIAVTSGNVIAAILCIALNFKKLADAKGTIISGISSGCGASVNMYTMIAFTAVVSATPAYATFTNWILGISGSPYIQAIIASNLIGLITASGGATVQFTLQSFGPAWLATGVNAEALTRVVSLASIGLSCGPHAGGLFTNLDVSGVKMKDGFLPQFIVGGVTSIIASLVITALTMAGIVF